MSNNVIPVTSKPKHLSIWKTLTKTPLRRSVLAIGGVLSISTILLRKKRTTGIPADPDVEDFTENQQAMLTRVREIWSEYGAGDPANG